MQLCALHKKLAVAHKKGVAVTDGATFASSSPVTERLVSSRVLPPGRLETDPRAGRSIPPGAAGPSRVIVLGRACLWQARPFFWRCACAGAFCVS